MVNRLLTRRRQRSFRRLAEQGFTLIEMLVVISIIALIMALGWPARSELSHRIQSEGCKDPNRKSVECA